MNGPEEMAEALENRVQDCREAHEAMDCVKLRAATSGLQQMIVEVSKEAAQFLGTKSATKKDPIVELLDHVKKEILPELRRWENDLTTWEAAIAAAKARDNENTGAVA